MHACPYVIHSLSVFSTGRMNRQDLISNCRGVPFLTNTYAAGGSKVYDVSKYLDDHPGGAEVMLDVAGQNADEFFEDIGHSKEAREELKKYLIGTFKLDEATLAKMKADAERKAKQGGQSSMLMVAIIAIIAIYVAYTQMS